MGPRLTTGGRFFPASERAFRNSSAEMYAPSSTSTEAELSLRKVVMGVLI